MAFSCACSQNSLLSSRKLLRSQQYELKSLPLKLSKWLHCNIAAFATRTTIGRDLARRSPSTLQETNGFLQNHDRSKTLCSPNYSNLSQNKRHFSSEELTNNESKDVSTNPFASGKTKLTVINENIEGKPRYPYVFKYSNKGFVIGSNQIIGSAALVKGSVFSWKVFSHHQITPASLSLFTTIHPKLEVLILGVGEKVVQLSPEVWEFLRKESIPVEVLDTPNACATYNFLTEEGRITAAGLIPFQNIQATPQAR